MARMCCHTIVIQKLPRLNPADKTHWRTQTRESKEWRGRVAWLSKGKAPRTPLRNPLVICTRYSTAEPDYDNLVASFKALVDGVVDAGWAEGDKPSQLGREYHWERVKKRSEQRVEIAISGWIRD